MSVRVGVSVGEGKVSAGEDVGVSKLRYSA